MKLSLEDKELLLGYGYLEKDFDQIEEAIKATTFVMNNEKISLNKTIEVLGKEKFLNGIGRSAFHWSAYRKNKDGQGVYFDSSVIFRWN